jgi:cytokinesis protein
MTQILPTADDEGKLNKYRNAPEETLAELHHADRFLVELLKVPFLKDRINGMHFQVRFQSEYDSLSGLATRVIEACEALQSATHFRNLLNVCRLILTIARPD